MRGRGGPLSPQLWLLSLLLVLQLAGQELTVKDTLGRRVMVPARVSRVLSLQPEVTRIIVALGADDRIVGRDHFIARYDHLASLISPRLSQLPVASAPDGTPYEELVMRLAPDLIFASPSEVNVSDALQIKTGIPVLAFASMGRFSGLLEEIRWAGAALARKERAETLVAYFRQTLAPIQKAIADIPAGRRPRVYLSFWSYLDRTPVCYEPVEAAGGRNLAEGLLPAYLGTLGTKVSLERILDWDPDVILLQGSDLAAKRKVTTSGVLNDPRLRSVRAVRERRVYYTFGFWYWWDPAQVLVETLMLAKLFYPQRFKTLDLRSEANAIFKTFYGIEGGFDVLARILEIPEGPWR